MKKLSLAFFFSVTAFFSSCHKGDSAATGNTPPTNLTVTATVSTDNSGNVSFTAAASNASSYEYDFGNGIFQTVPTGIVTYMYPASGTYTVNVTAKSATGQTLSKSIQITVTKALVLLWSDEFNTPGLPDVSKWNYDIGTGSGGWGNNELEYYTNRLSNAEVVNGVLKITVKKENFSGSSYTSARLLTKDKFFFKYGKVETRAKLPAGGGTWPAIWMLGTDINTVSWPACGEIDIMEHLGNDINKIYGTLHYPGRSGGNANGSTKIIANATTEFHIYSLEWSPSYIKIYVDDQLYHTVANSSSIPFNHDFFLIANVAMGGNFGGSVDPAFTNASMEIDYIRVYQ
jgi:beta-glucanase (GH16 family)